MCRHVRGRWAGARDDHGDEYRPTRAAAASVPKRNSGHAVLTALIGTALFATGATPAFAALTPVQIYGTVTGTQTTIICPLAGGPSCLATTPLSQEFHVSGLTDIIPGENSFTFGGFYTFPGAYSGFITDTAGFFTGHDLSFGYSSCSPGASSVGCYTQSAGAASFGVIGGIPEPSTWAMMLLGFGLIGSILRGRRARRPIRIRA
ncbi:MAG: PEPxxWA-CTERM sorting domain-containing protein [Novosphingobium sp.]|nr:PEPxxWA-CTERM sorting domain-containing protein [Novosphingobium sp.]